MNYSGTIGSIKFGYNTRSSYWIDTRPPYAFCGDGSPAGNYVTCINLTTAAPGQLHTVSATSYSGTRANGTKGDTKSVSFRIVNVPPTSAPSTAPTINPSHTPSGEPSSMPSNASSMRPLGQIDRFILINADTDLPIVDLVNGTVINVATLNTTNFNIQATLVNHSGTIGSIKFGYNTRSSFWIDTRPPYAFCGDGSPSGNYVTCINLTAGTGQQHIVSATSYSGNRANGTKWDTKAIFFRMVNIPPTPSEEPSNQPSTWPSNVPSMAPSLHPLPIPICNIPKVSVLTNKIYRMNAHTLYKNTH